MSDETDKPKRKYVRKSYSGVESIDSVINKAIEDEANLILDEAGVETDEIEVEEIAPEKPAFIYNEPKADTLAAKLKRRFGFKNRMESLKPWKGHPRFGCSKCGWETFDERAAKRHSC